jgi:hypothetical protein
LTSSHERSGFAIAGFSLGTVPKGFPEVAMQCSPY